MTRRIFFLAFFLSLVTGHWSLVTAVEAAHVEYHEGLPIVFLEGTPYELGRQHGELLRETVQHSLRHILGHFRRYLKAPLLSPLAVNWWLGRSWAQSAPLIPQDYLEELRGVSDGSGVPLAELWRLHAIPERTYACSTMAVWGRATADGRLIHTRNLDWSIRAGIQDYAAVFVVRPKGKHGFVSAGWAGFIGVLSGINERGLSIGQVGAETLDASYRGVPMAFLMRKVLEDATDLDGAVGLIRDAPRTVGVNYVIADAAAQRAVAMETTAHLAAVFEADDPKEHAVAYARPIVDAVVRADTAIDPAIRERQLTSRGNPRVPGLEPPGGSAYTVRYLGQGERILAHYGAITAQLACEIAKAVAPGSNVQSVVFAWPWMWVANAQDQTRAAHAPYHRLDLHRLFTGEPAP